MLEHFGYVEAATAIVSAIERTLATPEGRTRDLGGNASTNECGQAVLDTLRTLTREGIRS